MDGRIVIVQKQLGALLIAIALTPCPSLKGRGELLLDGRIVSTRRLGLFLVAKEHKDNSLLYESRTRVQGLFLAAHRGRGSGIRDQGAGGIFNEVLL